MLSLKKQIVLMTMLLLMTLYQMLRQQYLTICWIMKPTLPKSLSDTETEYYGLSDAETIDYMADIKFLKKIPQHLKNQMKTKLRDKIQKTIESNKNKLKNKEHIRKTIKYVFNAFENDRIKKEEEKRKKKKIK